MKKIVKFEFSIYDAEWAKFRGESDDDKKKTWTFDASYFSELFTERSSLIARAQLIS